MKKHDVFTFIDPNGVEVTAVVVCEIHVTKLSSIDVRLHTFLCYGQNRLFRYAWLEGFDNLTSKKNVDEQQYVDKVVEYCILPDYDAQLEEYQHQQDMANDYASREY